VESDFDDSLLLIRHEDIAPLSEHDFEKKHYIKLNVVWAAKNAQKYKTELLDIV